MKNIIFKYFIVLVTLSVVSSCSDDFLEETNPNIIAKDNFWRNLKETELGLNATYKTLYNPGVLNIIDEALRSDFSYPGYGRPVPSNTEPFYNYTYNSSSPEIATKWQTNYQGIYRANQVIEALNNIKADSDPVEWTSQMAQARFLRGTFHYYLYSTFNNGSIIIRDAVPVTSDDFSKALSPAEDVLKFIRDDLQYAYENLYKKGAYPSNDITRVTSGAAATILGTTFLNELDYEGAMPYFEDVIDNHGYALEYDMTKLFTTAGEFNKESIFEINFTSDFVESELDRWSGETGTNWLNQQTSNTRGPVGSAWITYAYKSEQMDPLDARNYYTDVNTGRTLRNVPLRASAMLAVVDDNQTTYYVNGTTSEYARFNGTAWGFSWFKKYQNCDLYSAESEVPLGSTYSSKNVTVNRLAEVLLMQAECKIKTGDIDGGIQLMNEIRKRWGLVLLGAQGADVAHSYDGITYDEASLMKHLIEVEKPLELSIEGHATRSIDFHRWNKSGDYPGGFKKRLEFLSSQVFYGVNFTYFNNTTGKTQTRNNFPSIVKTDPGTNRIVVDYEFKIPALNYDEAKHGTYPIPSSEINSNSKIN